MSDTLKIYGVTYTGVTSLNANDLNHVNKQYVRPEGTKSITANGTGIDVASYANVDVAVSSEPDIPIFSTDDFETFTCNKTFAECLALFNNREYRAIFTYQSESSSGIVERRVQLIGYTVRDEEGPLRYCLVANGVPQRQINYYPTGTINMSQPDSLQTLYVTANDTYTASSGEVWNEVTVNVSSGSPSLQTKSKTYTPTESQQTESVTADSGYDGLSAVNVTVEAIPSDYVGTSIPGREDLDLIVSGDTVTVPSGYYSQQAVAYVDSGTVGTPTATKGTVSNHSVSVTPSVTNTTGYITGGTKNGTAVTVSASELVSGSQTITDNGTTDVTNLASVTVAIPFVTYYTGTSDPSASLGEDGDIYLKVVS